MKTKSYSTRSKSKTRANRRPLVTAAVGVGLLVILMLALELTNTTHVFHKDDNRGETGSASGQISSKGEQPNSSHPNNTTSNTTTSKTSSDSPTPTGAAPKAPFGNFVSSHSATLSSQVSSTCTTTAGATCTITFTKSGVSKSLAVKTTDSDGAVYWFWTPQSVGLSTGSWQVTANATLNNQTTSTIDNMLLEVSQ